MSDTKLTLCLALLAALSVVCLAVSAAMLRASMNKAKKGEKVTVVVLGCRVKGDRPSLMLEGRLRAAARYLEHNKSACCIVSGGMGEDELYPEADIMKAFLVSLGISPERIIREPESCSTKQNIQNSISLIKANGLPEKLAIATDRFHQYRAQLYAARFGAQSCAINRETRWYLVMQYWFREIAGISMLWLKSCLAGKK